MAKALKILFVASEVVPFAKTGGLADVASALPKALFNLGCDVKIILPKYRCVEDKKFNLAKISELSEGGKLKLTNLPNVGVNVYFIQKDEYYDRDELYTTEQGDYPDNAERFIYFNKACLEMLRSIKWKPDCIHCNDWQAGLIPVYLKTTLRNDDFYRGISTLFTIHNIAYQGFFSKSVMKLAGLPMELYTPDKLEYWGNFSFLKAGLVFTDVINTVSEKYSEELQTPEFGRGMEGILKIRKDDLYGITNGIDYDKWNPSLDKNIPVNYDLVRINKKTENKKILLEYCNLPYESDVPVIGIVSRLDDQKGFDILCDAMESIMNMDVRLVILGKGEKKYYNLFEKFNEEYNGKFKFNYEFNDKLAHLIYAGSDFFLMPSKFEPCGLGQLISFKYGTVPIVRETGGFIDTVKNFNAKTNTGSGFVFSDYSPKALFNSIREAIEVYKRKKSLAKLIINIMNLDFSWEKSAISYIELYKKAIKKTI